MQTCNCSNTYKYKNGCVICGDEWIEKTEKTIEDELADIKTELETLRRNICVYANEEMHDAVYFEGSETPDQDVIDYLQGYYEGIHGVKG